MIHHITYGFSSYHSFILISSGFFAGLFASSAGGSLHTAAGKVVALVLEQNPTKPQLVEVPNVYVDRSTRFNPNLLAPLSDVRISARAIARYLWLDRRGFNEDTLTLVGRSSSYREIFGAN
jgi:hypothetical protein